MSYCPRCGKQIPERTYFCAACGYYPSDSPRERPIEESEANVLSHIYVKQNVRSSGVLASEFEVPSLRKSVGKLEDGGLVVPDKFYRFETLRCTETGSQIASIRLSKYFEVTLPDLGRKLARIPSRIYRFLVFDCISQSSSWPAKRKEYLYFDWRQYPFWDTRTWESADTLISILQEASEEVPIIAQTSNYVSTRGGSLREPEAVFPPETIAALKRVGVPGSSLTAEETRPFRIAQFFTEVAPYLVTGTASEKRIDDVNEFVEQKIKTLQLRQEDISAVVEDLSRNGVCSGWRGLNLFSSETHFDVNDATALRHYLTREIVSNGVTSLLSAGRDGKAEPSPDRFWQSRPARLLGGGPEFNRATELYERIAILELALRSMIESRLKAHFGEKWIDTLPNTIAERWKDLRREDVRASREPEQDFVNYADFADYSVILTCKRYRGIFEDRFGDPGDTKTAIAEIGAGRNRTMHLRTITDEVYYSTNRWIRWVEDRLASKG